MIAEPITPGARGAQILRVLDAQRRGQLNEHEADAYLRAEHGITLVQARAASDPDERTHERRERLVGIASAIILLLLLAAVFVPLLNDSRDGLSGFAVLDVDGTASGNATFPVTSPVIAFTVSGTLTGEGTATFWFDTDENRSLLVGTVASDDGTPRTARASYAPGDDVLIDHLQTGASVYLDDGATTTIVPVPFPAPAASAELLIVANESGELSATRIPLIIGDAPRVTAFADLCDETCALDTAVTGTLRVELMGNTTVDIRASGTTPEPNRAPIVTVPLSPLRITGPVTIDLAAHIIDPDGDDLLFSTGLTDIVDARVAGSTLTLTPLRDGALDLAIYASDLTELIETSIPLTVSFTTAPEPNETPAANGTNGTTPLPEPPAVGTNQSLNLTNGTLSPIDCSAADPNERPVECLLADPTAYFPEEDIYLENLDRARVAKLNMVGNLLLLGDVIPYSSAEPGSRDFVIGQPDRDGNTIVAAWIDSTSGDLHLRGALLEEEVSVNPPAGSYSIITRRSIYLAYVDLATGDLHLRGNVIPYRRSLG